MAYTTINKSSEYFDTKIYTGNGSSQTLNMDYLGLLWMKNRTETSNNILFDVVRGGYYTSAPGPELRANTNIPGSGSDITSAYGITFGSSSSTIGSDGGGYNYNQNGKSYVGWQWRANGAGSANTNGSINTIATSANTTAGFSISTYTGTGSNATIGHGLGVAPAMIITKATSFSEEWLVYHQSMGNTDAINLNLTNAKSSSATYWQNTTPSSSVFYVGSNDKCNKSGATYVAYCFSDVQGFSKMGSYVGNANADGAFIYTGFKPAFVIIKDSTSAGYNWLMYDNKRLGYNEDNKYLVANENYAEAGSASDNAVDLLSNGFKFRTANQNSNRTNTYMYITFGQSLVGTNGITNNAR